ncbi:unnamed protein product [Cylindrotheca closterium]|uniref:Uncharacterized protein n=1 Tax=Cylindrotheca closterium TaxID=2856 RepID=A0AAD2PVK8_9STRA|nr:unnamed protein product [Cylindrotheca closterium]
MEYASDDGDDISKDSAEELLKDGNENGAEHSTIFRLQTDSDAIPSGPNETYISLIIHEPVTRIPFDAFRSWSRLESVVISSLVMDVGMSAFAECNCLKEVEMMSCTMVRIGASAFDGCPSLQTVRFYETCSLVELRDRTFKNCTALKELQLPAGLKTIMDHCFLNCTSLGQMDLPKGLVELGGSSFMGCTTLKGIDIPGSVVRICELTFCGCCSLKSVNLQEGLLSISSSAFSFCLALESVQFPSTLFSIGSNSFASCTSLVMIELPIYLRRIDDRVFSACSNLKRVWAPPFLESIGHRAFQSCSILVSIEIRQDGNLSSIRTSAMEGCTNLRNIALPPTANPSELTFSHCHEMIKRTKNMDLLEALQNRFEGLTVHDICYHGGKDLTVARLEDALNADSNESFLRRDKLGLNLLQILLLSFNPKRGILIFLARKYPSFVIPDSFGIRLTIDAAVQRVIDDLCYLDSLSTMQDILDVSLYHRVKMLGAQTWKNTIYNLVGSLSIAHDFWTRKDGILRILSKLESYERLETTSLLELAVWKSALVLGWKDPKKLTTRERNGIRVTNGSNVIIPQVARFFWDVDVD